LASLLNGMWVQPVSSNDMTHMANSTPAQFFPQKPTSDKSSVIDEARSTRGPDAAVTTGWRRRIESSSRAETPRNKRDTARL
jgi:hypothetical protein